MGVKRQFNYQSQMRLDVPHMRLIEAAISGDFDALAGYIISGKQPLVVNGFTLDPAGIGAKFDQLKVVVAGSALFHYGASESGTVFTVPTSTNPEQLTSTNTNVSGSFVTNADNYVGLDLVRAVDNTTRDKVAFLDSGTKQETSKNVPLARALNYRFVISARSFSSQSNVLPLAIVTVDSSGFVTKITDARKLMFRLGSGGDVPNTTNSYLFSQRADGPNFSTISATNPFIGGDKDITSQKTWQDAMMTRVWEIAGGEFWYSRTAGHDVSMTRTGSIFSNGDYYEVAAGHVHWQGISFVFTNSTAARNDIKDQSTNLVGTTDLAIGECVYVDVDRTADHISAPNWQAAHAYVVGDQVTGITGAATGYVYEVTAQTGVSAGSGGPTGGPGTTGIIDNLVTWKWVGYTPLIAKKATMSALGAAATLPGSRIALIWRTKAGYYARGTPYTIGTTAQLATNIGPGIVRLNKAAAVPSDPVVMGWNERDSASGVAGLDAALRVLGTGLTRDAAGILTIGDQANDTSVAIGKSGANTAVAGTMSVAQLLSLAAGLDMTSAAALNIGATQANAINISKSGVLTKVFGTFEVAQAATFDTTVAVTTKITTPDIENAGNLALGTDGTTQPLIGSNAKPATIPNLPSGWPNNAVHGLNVVKAWAAIKIAQSGVAGAGGRTVTGTAYNLTWAFSGTAINWSYSSFNMAQGEGGYVVLHSNGSKGQAHGPADTDFGLLNLANQTTTGFSTYYEIFNGGSSQWIQVNYDTSVSFTQIIYIVVIGQS
jgi:hypothetical protein